MVENPMNNAVIVKTQVTLSVDVVKFEAQDVITASGLPDKEVPDDKENIGQPPVNAEL